MALSAEQLKLAREASQKWNTPENRERLFKQLSEDAERFAEREKASKPTLEQLRRPIDL